LPQVFDKLGRMFRIDTNPPEWTRDRALHRTPQTREDRRFAAIRHLWGFTQRRTEAEVGCG
jgi:hypothetical protein